MKNNKYIVLRHLSVPSKTVVGESTKVRIVNNDGIKDIMNSAHRCGVIAGKTLSSILS